MLCRKKTFSGFLKGCIHDEGFSQLAAGWPENTIRRKQEPMFRSTPSVDE